MTDDLVERLRTLGRDFDDWDTAADRIEALTAERDALIAQRDAVPFDTDALGMGLEMAAQSTIRILTAERDDLAHVIDNTESVYGISSEGNMWRFWAKKAKEIAAKNSVLTADNAWLRKSCECAMSEIRDYMQEVGGVLPLELAMGWLSAALNTRKDQP
jgi:hypothetical protein